MKNTVATLLAISSFAAVSSAALTAVFEYEFDTFYDARSTTVTDLRAAMRNARIQPPPKRGRNKT